MKIGDIVQIDPNGKIGKIVKTYQEDRVKVEFISKKSGKPYGEILWDRLLVPSRRRKK